METFSCRLTDRDLEASLRAPGRAPAAAEMPAMEHPYDPWDYPGALRVNDQNRFNPYNGYHGNELEFVETCLAIFHEAGLLMHFGIEDGLARRFFANMYASYGAMPYHCALHGQEVLAAAHCLTREIVECGHGPFTKLEILALYVAALGHDAGHFGVNNAYLQNSRHALYKLYTESTLEHYHAQILAQIVTHPADGIASCVPEAGGARAQFFRLLNDIVLATDMSRHKHLVGEFQWWVEELAGGSVGAGVFLRQGDSARGSDADGLAGAGGITELLRFGGERADRAPALVRARRLDTERREMLLIICMKCADLSGLVMDLPRADFWGYRIMMENLKQGEREMRERVEQTTPTTREGALANYFAHQAGFLEHIVLPMFDTLTLFTSGRFRKRVLALGSENLAAWRKGHGEVMITRATRQREAALTRHLLRCCAGFLMVVVFIISRGMLLRKTMNEMAGDFRGSANPYAAQALDDLDVTRFVFRWIALVFGFLAACCLALASPSVGARCSASCREAVINVFLVVQIIVRYSMNFLRYNTVKSMTRAGMFDIVGDPFVRKSAAQLYLNGVGVTNLNHVVTPCMFTLIYYIGQPYYSPGFHWFLHCTTVALRYVLDHNLKVNEADTSMLGLVWRMEDVTKGWLTMLAFPLALAVFDGRGFRALTPGPVKKQFSRMRRWRYLRRVRARADGGTETPATRRSLRGKSHDA